MSKTRQLLDYVDVFDFKDLNNFLTNYKNIYGHEEIGQDCKTCLLYKNCRVLNKASFIEDMPYMKKEDSRFPGFAVDFVNNHIMMLHYIPEIVFRILRPLKPVTLPCPYQGIKVINNIEKCEEVYNALSDDFSKLVYLNILMFRLTGNKKYIYKAYSPEPQYFIKPFRNLNKECVYVDCGAYTGDTFSDYCQFNEIPRISYLFEPDYKNAELLKHTSKRMAYESEIKIIEKGVYNNTKTLYFVNNMGSRSFLSEEYVPGSIKLNVTKIDEAISEDISFVKMDIEGSEKEAIIGAKNSILKSYPKLAICIYHYVEDLWEIPLMIKALFPDYTNYEICHHSSGFAETVLYVYK